MAMYPCNVGSSSGEPSELKNVVPLTSKTSYSTYDEFDVKGIPKYKNLTTDNFIVELKSAPLTKTYDSSDPSTIPSVTNGSDEYYVDKFNNVYGAAVNSYKRYDANTGILTIFLKHSVQYGVENPRIGSNPTIALESKVQEIDYNVYAVY